jgi:ribosomal protein S18 acetylase RimI-like enzyme
MNRIKQLHDRNAIATWLRRDVAMNIFALCDLDHSEIQRTKWLGLHDDTRLRAILLVYAGPEGPLVLPHGDQAEAMRILEMSRDVLPREFYLSLAMPFEDQPNIKDAEIEHRGDYLRMVPHKRTGKKHNCDNLVPITNSDAERVQHLLFADQAYPDAWFKERSLQTGLYRGWVENGDLLGVVGVHAASDEFGVAAIGNLAVRPDARRKGIACIRLEDLVNDLHERGWQGAFNVRAENTVAISLYTQLGCQVIGTVREFEVTLNKVVRQG